jgi:hypothetical protein
MATLTMLVSIICMSDPSMTADITVMRLERV